jgi:signal transduction histidine kinase
LRNGVETQAHSLAAGLKINVSTGFGKWSMGGMDLANAATQKALELAIPLRQITIMTTQSLLAPLRARLPRRIMLWAFLSILGIELVILIPSVSRRQDELLNQVATTSKRICMVLNSTSANSSDQQLLDAITHLQQQQTIVGGALWHPDQHPAKTVGEPPTLSLTEVKAGTLDRLSSNHQRYDVAHSIQVNGNPRILILRHDTSDLDQEVLAFIWRIAGLVLVISIVVTITLSVVIAYTVVQPILQLRHDLLRSGEAIIQDQAIETFVSTSYRRQDELGEVIQAFQHMYQQIVGAIADRKTSETLLRESSEHLQQTLQTLNATQTQLIQTEKMASLGQLVAGVAHEVNNPINFIHGNLSHIEHYIQDLLGLVHQLQSEITQPSPALQQTLAEMDLEFIRQDLPSLLQSMNIGADRIREIVQSFRNFSRLDEADYKRVDLHSGLDSSLDLLRHRLAATDRRPAIQVKQHCGELPLVECYAAQLNQVFFELLKNAIEALETRDMAAALTPPTITITTTVIAQSVQIIIADTGIGMTAAVQQRAFDPFFTTKDVGQGQGLGLAIAYQTIVAGHRGTLAHHSELNHGTEVIITLPIATPSETKSPLKCAK